MDATKEQIRKLRVDALYGKKKHFNAADRKRQLRLWLNIPVVIINALLGSLLISILEQSSPEYFKWLAAIFAFFAAVLTSITIFLDLAKQVEGHRRVGNKYISVAKHCERLLAYKADDLIEEAELVKRFEKIATVNDEVNREAEAFHTSSDDYRKAQKGMQAGEEEYLPQELGD